MKRALYLLMLLLAGFGVSAQSKKMSPADMADKRTAKMHSVLSLKDEQYASIREINLRYATRRQEMRSTQKPDAAELRSLRLHHRAEIDKVLTSDQQARWHAFREEQKAERKKHRGAHHGDLKKELSLTDQQHAALKKLNRDMHEKRKALKQSSLSREEMKYERLKLHDTRNQRLHDILTEDQIKKLREHQRARRQEHRHKPD